MDLYWVNCFISFVLGFSVTYIILYLYKKMKLYKMRYERLCRKYEMLKAQMYKEKGLH